MTYKYTCKCGYVVIYEMDLFDKPSKYIICLKCGAKIEVNE